MTNKTLDALGAITTPASSDLFPILHIADGVLKSITYQNLETALAAAITIYPKGHLFGLTLSTAGSSTTFSVAAGVASDSTDVALLSLGSSMNKTTAAWLVGTGNGSLDSGSIAANTWYHVYLIYRADTAVTDVIVSTNATAPSLPASYTLYRRIGSIRTDGSNNWLQFVQTGDRFIWSAPVGDVNTTIGTTAALQTLTLPLGITTTAMMNATCTVASGQAGVVISSPLVATQVANTPVGNMNLVGAGSALLGGTALAIDTNTSSQVRAVALAAGTGLFITTTGWIDTRGRLA
jgi:hypothetical protein